MLKNYKAEVLNNNTNDSKYVLKKYMEIIDPKNSFYIDIGSSFSSNLEEELLLNSEKAIFFECNPEKEFFYKEFEKKNKNFHFINEKVTPENIVKLIKQKINRKDPKMLDIDIDGYDYYVLQALLLELSPSIIIAEINEKIPPPIKFTVKYDKDYWWDGSHFYGMSLSKAYEVFERFDYDVVNLTYNNVFAVKKEKNPGLKCYDAEELYNKFYKNADWQKYYDYNKNVEYFLNLDEKDLLKSISEFYKNYNGKYDLYI